MNDEAGTHRAISRAVLGHSGPAMSDTYSHIDTTVARRAMEKALKPLA